jgi:hypothetical protein
MLLGMLCEVTSAKHAVLYEVTSAKHAPVSLEKIRMGANGQTGGKNCSSTFVQTSFISFGLFNVFPKSDPI